MSIKDSIKGLWGRVFGPKLRCKPGDLCLIVRQCETQLLRGDVFMLPTRLGIIVEVVAHDGKTWAFKDPLKQRVDLCDYTLTVVIYGMADEFLQPLPKLEEPAECEALQAGKPQDLKTEVPA